MASKYPYPSDIDVREYVTVKLSQSNYFIWRSMMLSLIQSQGLRRFIHNISKTTGYANMKKEEEEEEEEIEKDDYWRRTDELVRGWILATLHEDLVTLVERLETAKQVWPMLEEKLTQPFLHGIDTEQTRVARNNISPYLPLAKAALNGDWEKARKFFEHEPNAVRAIVTGASETALMVAARSVQRSHFIKKLVDVMTPADLAMVDYSGSTALHMAARTGNKHAAKLLVNKNPRLPNIPDNDDLVPLHIAVLCCKKKMVLYLLGVTKEDEKSRPFEDERGRTLLSALIASGFYDIALLVVQRFPDLVRGDPNPLQSIALKVSDFESGADLNLWQQWIYSCVPINKENKENRRNDRRDIEDAADSFMSVRWGTKLKPNLNGLVWRLVEIAVPLIKHVRDKKVIHHQALQFVKHLCKEIAQFDYSDAVKILRGSLHMAASIGVHEIVEEILESFPSAVYLTNTEKQTIFHIAIKNRRENVFNIIYQFPGLSHIFFKTPDISMNTGLHLAGLLGDHQRQCLRTCAVGPALQMQRELQWFQEVEKLSVIMDKQQLNDIGKTPVELFNETHQELMEEGEQWMKGTSSSCTIVAALVVTIVFAAAITVPGGNKQDTGLPFFSTRKAFIIFAISDALALFSSTSSLLLFLSIQSSHYAEQDFLSALPKRLICGFLTLFLSILFMMIAFASTLQIVFGDTTAWILVPVIGLACIPVTLFASLQFPRLIDMIKCTYGSGNFCKQSDRPLF